MNTMTEAFTANNAVTVLREIDLNNTYKLTAGNSEGDCIIEGVCFEKNTNFFLTISTDMDIPDETIGIIALRNIHLKGLIAPSDDEEYKILLAQSLFRNIRTRSSERIKQPKLIVRFGDKHPQIINDLSQDGIGITINVDDYSCYSAVKECVFILDKDILTVRCELINSQYLGNGSARLGWKLSGDAHRLQELLNTAQIIGGK